MEMLVIVMPTVRQVRDAHFALGNMTSILK
jgi:hypothetical protein